MKECSAREGERVKFKIRTAKVYCKKLPLTEQRRKSRN
jgi:hypothetical protein